MTTSWDQFDHDPTSFASAALEQPPQFHSQVTPAKRSLPQSPADRLGEIRDARFWLPY
jgi:hypothetical protein